MRPQPQHLLIVPLIVPFLPASPRFSRSLFPFSCSLSHISRPLFPASCFPSRVSLSPFPAPEMQSAETAQQLMCFRSCCQSNGNPSYPPPSPSLSLSRVALLLRSDEMSADGVELNPRLAAAAMKASFACGQRSPDWFFGTHADRLCVTAFRSHIKNSLFGGVGPCVRGRRH